MVTVGAFPAAVATECMVTAGALLVTIGVAKVMCTSEEMACGCFV